jgi:hypothetical protein
MLAHPEIEWFLVLDGDVAVINPVDHKVEDYIGSGEQDLVFGMRYHNNEIAAAYFMVRNSRYGRDFIEEWYKLADRRSYGGMNHDNGALHWMLLHRLVPPARQDPQCLRLGASTDYLNSYAPFVACVHRHLATTGCDTPLWRHVLIIPYMRSFAYDLWHTNDMWTKATFMQHDLKKPRPEFAQCPPYPDRSIGNPHFTSYENHHELLVKAAKEWQERRSQHGYDPNSCIFSMKGAANIRSM